MLVRKGGRLELSGITQAGRENKVADSTTDGRRRAGVSIAHTNERRRTPERVAPLVREAIDNLGGIAEFIKPRQTVLIKDRNPEAENRADFYSQRRFLSFDLSYGNSVQAEIYEYVMDNGMSREEYHWFMGHGNAMRPHCVMGNDYYSENEHRVPPEGPIEPAGEIFGYYNISKQYFERCHLPVMHTGTNLMNAEKAPDWFWKEWENLLFLRREDVPIIGFTWYSLTDQVDWDTKLREDNGHVNPAGLYALDRRIRPVGKAYRELISEWRGVMPMKTFSLPA